MASIDPTNLAVGKEARIGRYKQRLAELFSGYRAEWVGGDIFDLFTEPSYFPQLITAHPCFLVGGRGTGKTTALRCLSYQGQAVLRGGTSTLRDWPYYGLYYRVNTNRVRAFAGPEVSEATWSKLFAHYMNLDLCELVVDFLIWYEDETTTEPALDLKALARIALALHLNPPDTAQELRQELDIAKLRFEAAINNIADDRSIGGLSLQGAPIDTLLREVKARPEFASSSFFFLIDEYENLLSFQQRVTNTLVKHCGPLYTFKVGVREFGHRERSTVNPDERLRHPADFKLIDIAAALESKFGQFAERVCSVRLAKVFQEDEQARAIGELLPELTPEEEAERLGIGERINPIVRELRSGAPLADEHEEWIRKAHPLELFVLQRRAEAEKKALTHKLAEAASEPAKWREQYGNFRYAYLFAIRPGKRGIRKFYAGSRIYSLLAGTNIRYMLELVDQALTRQLDAGGDLLVGDVAAEIQTKAAQETGHRNLRELEGLSLNGAKLARLLLGLGRVFQIMAEDPVGHTPEINQFCLPPNVSDEGVRHKVDELLMDSIMHLALRRYPGSKLQQRTDIRQFDYVVHPIFAPFFGFSHRRKRKMELSDADLLDLIERPTEAIRRIVGTQDREFVGDALPEQMALFSDYYDSPNA